MKTIIIQEMKEKPFKNKTKSQTPQKQEQFPPSKPLFDPQI
jgi:hypothetical protein